MKTYDVELKALRTSSPGLVVRELVEALSDEAAVGKAVVQASGRWPMEPGWSCLSAVEVTRPCRFCGAQVTSTNPETDFCRGCFYQGRWAEERCVDLIGQIRHQMPASAGLVWDSVGVWHTGGGCFAVGCSFTDGAEMLFTDLDAGIPEDGLWGFGYYLDDSGEAYADSLDELRPAAEVVKAAVEARMRSLVEGGRGGRNGR